MWAKLTLVTVILFSLPMLTDGQNSDTDPPKADAPPAEPQGLWPSPKLMDLILRRWADEVSHEYELDEVQRAKVRDAVLKRWSPFFKENSSTLRPLFNEFLEMRLELEPPEKKAVQAWAQRAMPVLEQVREQINQATAEFREILNPRQRGKFDLQVLEFGAGLQIAEKRLQQLQKGDFDVDQLREFWEPTAERRKHRQERRRRRMERAEKRAKNEAEKEQTDQIALEIKAWEAYVEEFSRVYHLNEGQRSAVLSCLSELKQRAMAHRDTRREDIAKLEQRIQSFSGAEEELAELKKQLTKLYGPIDEMFQELKRRTSQIPTAEQRAAVGTIANDE